MIAAAAVLLILITAVLAGYGRERDFIRGLDPKEHPLRFFYPAAGLIYRLLERTGHTGIFADMNDLKKLRVNADPARLVKENCCRGISYILAIAAGTCLLVVICLAGRSNPLEEGGRLKRNPTGGGDTSYDFTAEIEGGDEAGVPVAITVSEQKCPPGELETYFGNLFEVLEAAVLNGNSADAVTGDLKLVETLPGTTASVIWNDIDHRYIYSDGSVRHENITEPVIVMLTATLVYYDEERSCSFPVRLMPAPESGNTLSERLGLLVSEKDAETAGDAYLTLPEMLDGKKIGWSAEDNGTPLMIAVLGAAAAVLTVPALRSEVAGKKKEREKEMMRDYPDVISKFVLLITAGMTCRSAWEKICTDYLSGNSGAGRRARYVYEEMLKSLTDLKLGVPETTVYENFGNRCGILPYQRFGSMLSKNLRRGSRDLAELLELEAKEAFDAKRAEVRIKGEEAGTKLLFPMVGMLCLVIAVVVVPALKSLNF